MKSVFLLAVFLASCVALGDEPFDIGDELVEESFWSSDPVLFVKRHQSHGFKFTSEDRRMADSRRDGAVVCFGLPVYESRISFCADGGLERVELMLFTRGGTESVSELSTANGQKVRSLVRNDKTVSRAEFFKILSDVRGKFTKKGAKPPTVVDERTNDAKISQKLQVWPKSAANTVASLSWNYSQSGKNVDTFSPGFIRLTIDGPSLVAVAKSGKKTASGAMKIVENVVRDPRGDVFIDNVPMVDQGMKGYCAVAAAERVMRYYGLDVDEHEIAEVAGTQADEGTSTRKMRDAVDLIGKRYRLSTMLLFGDFADDVQTRIANLNKEVANYNKAAKKLKRKAIEDSVYISHEGDTINYNITALDEAMDPEVLKEMKTKGAQKSGFTKFKSDIKQYVDAGMPVYWGVLLGIYPETDLPQAKGGHMRLIIGYNEKKGEVLYSDTWGKGHELKRMPMSWAWTITRCLMAMKPLK